MFTAILFVVTILILTYLYFSNSDYHEKISKIKCVNSLPIIGHAHKFGNSEDILQTLVNIWNITGRDKFLLRMGPIIQHIVVTNPRDVEFLLVTEKIIKKNVLYENLRTLMGDGLLTAEPNKWLISRKTLNPAFYIKVIESHESVYESHAKNILKKIMKRPDEELEVFDMFMESVMSLLTTAGIGLDVTVDVKYVKVISDLVAGINSRVFSAWKSNNFLYSLTAEGKEFNKKLKWILETNAEVLKRKQESIRTLMDEVDSGENTLEAMTEEEDFFKKRLGVLDLLSLGRKANEEPFTAEEILVEVMTFTVAGVETTSSAASFALYNLATHPHVQKLALEEQLALTNGDLARKVTFAELKVMKYLEAVIKETLRLHCPIVFFGRSISKDTVLPDGTELPAGANIILAPFLSQRHPDAFEDPERFDPERFIQNSPLPYTYYPFAAGPRDCIGKGLAMVMLKFYLATLMRSIEVLPPKEPITKLKVELTLKTCSGIHIRWRNRQT